MLKTFDGWLVRWIPSAANRTLWKMSVGVMAAFAVTSPIWGSSIAAQLANASYLDMLPYGLMGNLIGLVIAALIMGNLMRRWSQERLSPRRQVTAVVAASTAGILARFLVVVVTFRYGYPRVGVTMVLTNLAISLSVIFVTSIVVLYVARREYDLQASYEHALATQAALVREEEDVRARIFDDLHGTVHARVLDIRHRIHRLGSAAPSGNVDVEIQALDQELADLYDGHIGRLARALYPSGLEVSLRTAVEELQSRHSGAIDIDLVLDPVVAVLDDPRSGGLHQDLRMALFRVIEECTINAIRHAGADKITIEIAASLESAEPHLSLVAANRCDLDTDVRLGHGLLRLRQRIVVLGGNVAVECGNSEFVVRVDVPMVKRA